MAHNNKAISTPSNTQPAHQPNPTEEFHTLIPSSDAEYTSNSTTADPDSDSIDSSTATESHHIHNEVAAGYVTNFSNAHTDSSIHLSNLSNEQLNHYSPNPNTVTDENDASDAIVTEARGSFQLAETDSYAHTNPSDVSNATTVARRPNVARMNINNNTAAIQFNNNSTDSNIRFEQDDSSSLDGSVNYEKPIDTSESRPITGGETSSATTSLANQHHTNNIASFFASNATTQLPITQISQWLKEINLSASEQESHENQPT